MAYKKSYNPFSRPLERFNKQAMSAPFSIASFAPFKV